MLCVASDVSVQVKVTCSTEGLGVQVRLVSITTPPSSQTSVAFSASPENQLTAWRTYLIVFMSSVQNRWIESTWNIPAPKIPTTTVKIETEISNSMSVKPRGDANVSRIGFMRHGSLRRDSMTRMLCPSLVTVTTTFSILPVKPSSAICVSAAAVTAKPEGILRFRPASSDTEA